MAENKWNRLNWSEEDKRVVGAYLQHLVNEEAALKRNIAAQAGGGVPDVEQVLRGKWRDEKLFFGVLGGMQEVMTTRRLKVTIPTLLNHAYIFAGKMRKMPKPVITAKSVPKVEDKPRKHYGYRGFATWDEKEREAVGARLYHMATFLYPHRKWSAEPPAEDIFRGDFTRLEVEFRALATELEFRHGTPFLDDKLLQQALKTIEHAGTYDQQKAMPPRETHVYAAPPVEASWPEVHVTWNADERRAVGAYLFQHLTAPGHIPTELEVMLNKLGVKGLAAVFNGEWTDFRHVQMVADKVGKPARNEKLCRKLLGHAIALARRHASREERAKPFTFDVAEGRGREEWEPEERRLVVRHLASEMEYPKCHFGTVEKIASLFAIPVEGNARQAVTEAMERRDDVLAFVAMVLRHSYGRADDDERMLLNAEMARDFERERAAAEAVPQTDAAAEPEAPPVTMPPPSSPLAAWTPQQRAQAGAWLREVLRRRPDAVAAGHDIARRLGEGSLEPYFGGTWENHGNFITVARGLDVRLETIKDRGTFLKDAERFAKLHPETPDTKVDAPAVKRRMKQRELER